MSEATRPPQRRTLQPAGWPRPAGYANGILSHGTSIHVGGMIGWDVQQQFAEGFVAQVRQTLENIVAVLAEGGAGPEHIVRMTWYVTDMEVYRASLGELGAVYRDVLGRTYPAMALVQVVSLVEREALVEIEATAVLP